VRIAGETSSSLSEIVSGVNESSRLVSDIASESEAQSKGIGQINTGIDEVAQVVQQNSATAEESAAASQEMSSQSALLRELIAQFKIRDAVAQPGLLSEIVTRGGAAEGPDRKLPESYGKY
jgi:methyl-accepting chemotaxis protein